MGTVGGEGGAVCVVVLVDGEEGWFVSDVVEAGVVEEI